MVLLVFILVLPALLLLILRKHRANGDVRLPPGPRGLPLIGNLHQLNNSFRHLHLWQLSQKYGPIMSLRLGLVPTLVASSAKMAKEIMKTNDLAFCSRPALTSQQKLFYNGQDLAFSPYNSNWRGMRKIWAVNLFTSDRVQHFDAVREYEVAQMISKISQSDLASEPVNLSEAMMRLVLNIIFRVALGKRYEEAEISRFQGMLDEAEVLLESSFVSDYLPFMTWVDKLSGFLPRLEKNFKEFDMFYQEIIEEHLDPKRPKPEHEGIIDVLLQLLKDRSFEVDLTFDHIKAILMDIFVGGTVSNAATVVWAMTFLMKNPIALKKAQEEVRNLLGKTGFVNSYDAKNLPYLKAVLKETLRLMPVGPLLIPRQAIHKCNIDGYEVQPKTLVFVNIWAIGRDPDTWENPEAFIPDRFIGSCIDMRGQSFELIPFGAGRRICPGMHMGIANIEVSLANLLYKFNWEMPAGLKKEDIDMDVHPGLSLTKKNPLCLVARNFI